MLFAAFPHVVVAQLPEYILEPTTRIGSVDDPETELAMISFLAVAPDGRIAVAQPADFSVWVFAPSGERIAVLGREGEGPGEHRNIGGIGWVGDTLWVADQRLWRVTFFPPGEATPVVVGGVTRRIDADMGVPLPAGRGRWLVRRDLLIDAAAQRRRYEFWALDSDWNVAQAIAVVPVGFHRLHVTRPDGSTARLRERPFTDYPLFGIAPDNASVTFVERLLPDSGPNGRYAVTRIAISGDTLFHHDRPIELQPLTEDTRTAVINYYFEYLQNVRAAGAMRGAIADSVRFPEYHPAFSKVLVGTGGSTWLRGPDDWSGSVRWLVLDATGVPVRTVVADRLFGIENMSPFQFGFIAADMNGAWAVEQDDMGVNYIIRYELRPAASGRRE